MQSGQECAYFSRNAFIEGQESIALANGAIALAWGVRCSILHPIFLLHEFFQQFPLDHHILYGELQ